MRGFFLPGPAGSRPEHLQRKKRGRLAITLLAKNGDALWERNGAAT
jgi:hypothetical protein